MLRSIRNLLLTLPLVALIGCGEDSPSSPSEDTTSVEDFVATASVAGNEGAIQAAAPPRPEGEAPNVTVQGPTTIINGGTATMNVSSETPFETLYVAASAPISGLFVPVNGFYEIPLPVPVTTADLTIAFPQTLPAESFGLYFSAADGQGNVGPVVERTFGAILVGTGDIQITLSWDTAADVDLHVVDPSGEEIYWANRLAASGGELDLDSNAACAGDNVRNENITWGVGEAPQGLYTVRVDYWSNCEASQTNYTVLIHNDGDDPQLYRGTFTGTGDGGGFGSGVHIATFSRSTGRQPAPLLRQQSAANDPPAKF